MEEHDNANCFFDFSLIEQIPVPGGELPSLEPDFRWSAHPFSGSTSFSTGFVDSFGNSDCTKDHGSRKRANPASCSATDTKACREKRRRDKLNERFQELNEILDPGMSTKMDKTVILGDAIRMVTQLRDEAAKLKESSQDLQAKINDLKAEKNELRDEKQRLKAEKERLEQQLKAFNGFPAPPFFPPPFSGGQSPIVGSKFLPFVGVPMWPFTHPTAVDTSEDHVLRSPLA